MLRKTAEILLYHLATFHSQRRGVRFFWEKIMARKSMCALCYHPVWRDQLCKTCHADWQQSLRIATIEFAEGYRNLTIEGVCDTQAKYITEFWARCADDDPVQIRREVTKSICAELGCVPAHYR